MNKLFKSMIVIIVLCFTGLAVFNASVSADCYQYSSTGTMVTSATPVLNNFCNVPNNIGNESNFVRIRQNVNGNDEDNYNNPTYSTSGLTSACSVGSKYDIWNYLHNNASTNYNPDVNPNDPSAVAKNVQENLTAQLGNGSVFNFYDTITASNAASVKASTTLNCGSNKVALSLVPGSVHIYSLPYGWLNLADSNINGGPVTVGSPIAGSGSMWGCWNYRIFIIYQIQVTAIPAVVTPPTCNIITIEANGSVAKLDNISYSAGSSNVTGASVNFGNGSTINLTPAQLNSLSATNPYSYTYSKPGNYTIQATINTSNGNVTSTNCLTSITVANTPTPPTTPPSTPPSTPTPPATTTTPPTTLVNTGPGNVIALFIGFMAFGIIGYRIFAKRYLSV